VESRLRSYDVDRTRAKMALGDSHKWKIWEAARATSAAPIFFAPFLLQRGDQIHGRFVDAGLSGVNNPSMLALEEKGFIKELADRPLGCLVSIGTGKPTVYTPRKTPSKFGRLVDHLVSVATDTEKTADLVAHTGEL
jgi:hypothetical protein